MKIAIDVSTIGAGGGVTYIANLLPELARLDSGSQYYIFVPDRRLDVLTDLPGHFHWEVVNERYRGAVRTILWQQIHLPIWLKRRQVDVLLSPRDTAPLFCPSKLVLAIRNLNPYWGPPANDTQGRIRERVLRLLTSLAGSRADAVFFVSEYSRRVISSTLGIPLDKSQVIYHGSAHSFSRPAAETLGKGVQSQSRPTPYVLCVSSIRVHKDYRTLISAFGSMIRRDRFPHSLVIVGRVLEASYYAELLSLVQELGLGTRVRFLGEISYDDMPALYWGADLFVWASLAETFGHPLVEAMMAEVPVLVADTPVAREICADAAEYFAPGDAGELTQKMATLLRDIEQRDALIEKGRSRASVFSWRRTAEQTLALLHRVVS